MAADLSPAELKQLADAVDRETRGGRWAEAEAACRSALAGRPGDGALLQMLGIVLVRAGRVADALDPLRRAAVARPTPAAFMSLGMALVTAADPALADEAIAAFERAGSPEADVQRGHLLAEAGRPADAAGAYRGALAVRPDWPPALVGLGNAHYAQGQLDDALACYRRASAIDPTDANAALNAGNVLAAQSRRGDAIAAFRASLAVRPNDPKAIANLATTLYLHGQLDEAEGIFRRQLVDRPNNAGLLTNLAGVMKDKGRLDESLDLYRRATAADPSFAPAAHSNLVYTLSFHPGRTPADVLAEARRYDAAYAAPLTADAAPHANDRSPDRRLRVGYVSPDLKHHAVGGFLLPLVEAHDRSAVDVFLYGLSVSADDLTDRLRASATWRDLGGLSDAQAAEAIRGDGIDVLVDLTLHMGHNRLGIFARRPAPVQVTYLAYAGTSGLSAIDYRLSDPYLDPTPASDADYAERTVRLPRTYWCYRPTYDVAAVADPPAAGAGFVTFGSLNNFCKVNDGVLAAWAQVLNRVPGSRLLMHAHVGDHRDAVARFMADRGVRSDRLSFVGMTHTRTYLAMYNGVDVGLDPFPYNGGTTTLDAMWMGVPVVSLAGDRAVGRAGRSILTNAGLPELAVDTPADYVRAAVALATDLPRLGELRRTMRDRLARSPLMDAAAFARDVEAAYRSMWRAWCAGTPG